MPRKTEAPETKIEVQGSKENAPKPTLDGVLLHFLEDKVVKGKIEKQLGYSKLLKRRPEDVVNMVNEFVPTELRGDWKKVKKGVAAQVIVDELEKQYQIYTNEQGRKAKQNGQPKLESEKETSQPENIEESLPEPEPVVKLPPPEQLASSHLASVRAESDPWSKQEAVVALLVPEFEKNPLDFTYNQASETFNQIKEKFGVTDLQAVRFLYHHYNLDKEFSDSRKEVVVEGGSHHAKLPSGAQELLRRLVNILQPERKGAEEVEATTPEIRLRPYLQLIKMSYANGQLTSSGVRDVLNMYVKDRETQKQPARLADKVELVGTALELMGVKPSELQHLYAEYKNFYELHRQENRENKNEYLLGRLVDHIDFLKGIDQFVDKQFPKKHGPPSWSRKLHENQALEWQARTDKPESLTTFSENVVINLANSKKIQNPDSNRYGVLPTGILAEQPQGEGVGSLEEYESKHIVPEEPALLGESHQIVPESVQEELPEVVAEDVSQSLPSSERQPEKHVYLPDEVIEMLEKNENYQKLYSQAQARFRKQFVAEGQTVSPDYERKIRWAFDANWELEIPAIYVYMKQKGLI